MAQPQATNMQKQWHQQQDGQQTQTQEYPATPITQPLETKAVLQPFRVVIVAVVGRSSILATTVTGGVLCCTLPQVRGTGAWPTMIAV